MKVITTGGTLEHPLWPTYAVSWAAPQVSGMAALMFDRNSMLINNPEAARAIIMATAVNNIDGPTGIVAGQDLKDGAGGIDAELAVATATTRGELPSTATTTLCEGPCWWSEVLSNTNVDAGDVRSYYFRANAGDHIRIAINWSAVPDCVQAPTQPENCTDDSLNTMFGLELYDHEDNTLVLGSTSMNWSNNYQLAPPDGDLVIPRSGIYRIAVPVVEFNEEENVLGVAWTKIPATAGAYDDSSPRVRYDGSGWVHNTSYGRPYAGTHSYTNVQGATAQLYFTGSRITYFYTMAPNRGRVNVYINGVLDTQLNAYAADVRWLVAKTWTFPTSQPRTIKIEAVDSGQYIALDAFVVDIPYASAVGTYDDADLTKLTYTNGSGWTHASGVPDTINTTLSWSNTYAYSDPDGVTFTFTGTQVIYVYTAAPNRGKAAITIDGVHQGYADAYSPTVLYNQEASFSGLGAGVHTINISVSPQRNPAATDYYVGVDAFVLPPP